MELIIFLIFCYFKLISSKVVPFIHEGYEMCVAPEERANMFDYSNLEIVAESDDEVFLNGSLVVLKNITEWKLTAWLERFQQGSWDMELAKKHYPDLCPHIQSPAELFYFISKKLQNKNCPFLAGVS